MARHTDFERIHATFLQHYSKDPTLAEERYQQWLKDSGLDETRGYYEQGAERAQSRQSFSWADFLLQFVKEDKDAGHRSVVNSMKYINIWKLSFRTETEYEFLAVTSAEELKVALLGGYSFVIEKFGASWFRRPKRIAIAGTPLNDRVVSPESLGNKENLAVKNL